MDYTVIWSRFSEKQIDKIFIFYEEKIGSRLANKIIRSILSAPDSLIKNSEMGIPEPSLENRQIKYRYIITTNYKKIIYSIDEDQKFVKIADVFDASKNPNKIEQ